MPITHLDELDVSQAVQGWESPKPNRAVTGVPLAIAGRSYARGLGTHTVGQLLVQLDGGAGRFTCLVGVDDAVGAEGHGRVRFVVRGDGRVLFDSGVRRGGEPAVPVDVDLAGIHMLELYSDAPDDYTHHGHADWCEGIFATRGAVPVACRRPRAPVRAVPAVPAPAPRLTGPMVVGVRPGAPLLHTCTAVGQGPFVWSAEGMPGSVHLDPASGRLTGSVATTGSHRLLIRAQGPAGSNQRELRIEAGSRICLTPPLGWNSWNCCGATVDAATVRRAARMLIDTGLAARGFLYVNIDDGWQGVRQPHAAIPMALQANAKFPDMKGLVDEIHALGLKAGIYHVPCMLSPAGLPGGSAARPDGTTGEGFVHGRSSGVGSHRYERQDAAQWAAWGFDYIKYDAGPTVDDARRLREALDATGRDIALSLSAKLPHGLIDRYRPFAQCWRTTGDLIDSWFGLRNKFREQRRWQDCSEPGAWNDPDMLILGRVGPGWSAPLQATRIDPVEQELHVGMWAMLAAPLLLGGHPDGMDVHTVAMLGNLDVLDIHQDALGRQARLLWEDEERQIWRRPLADGGEAVAMVNLGETTIRMAIERMSLQAVGDWRVRDCWSSEELGALDQALELEVPGHGHRLLRLRAG